MKPGTALALAAFAALVVVERRKPLRHAVEPGFARLARNAAIGAVTAAAVSSLERPIVTRLARHAEARKLGVLALPMPLALRTFGALLLMDYTLYWWHVLLHRVPLLWRLHEPHHIDRDLDASTALRFHFAEFVASIPWRVAQIALIGVGERTLALWQKLTFAEVVFHHSNVRLPRALERVLGFFVVTPRLHGIHHSVVRDERDSNYSSGLTVWDRLHATLRSRERDHVTIGMPGYDEAADVTLGKTLALPFRLSLATLRREPEASDRR